MLQLLFVAATAAAALALSGNSGCKQSPTQSDTTRTPRDTTPPPVTPDTTSSNFSWQLDTLGTQGELYDVAIINDTDVWAVGEIHTPQTDRYDSNGHWVAMYNAAHWDGRAWQLERIWWDSVANGIENLSSIFAFSSNDIWAAGSGLYHWSNGIWTDRTTQMPLLHSQINRIWGGSSSDFYLAENNGYIVHWNGRSFSAMATGTTLPIVDIYGDMNAKTGQEEILALASNGHEVPQGKALLRINGSAVTPVNDSGLSDQLSGIWFKAGEKYVVVGSGVGIKKSLQDSLWSVYPPGLVTSWYSDGVCGEGTNDIIVGDDYGEILHYNGNWWYEAYKWIMPPLAHFYSVRMKGNSVFAVGYTFGLNPVVLRGER